jgi:uncharacterized protein YigA (DUF484 family)
MTKKSEGPRKPRKNRPTVEKAVEQALPFPPASPAPETQAQASAPAAPGVQAPTQETEARPTGDAEVVTFLMEDPGFFERHPDLVASLQIPHPSGPAISLVGHQVGILRGQLEDERRRLAHIIARARDYEALSDRLHSLTLSLIVAPDQARIEAVLHEALCRELNAQCVTLKLFPVPDRETQGAEGGAPTDPLLAAFRDFTDRRHCLCGPLDAKKARLLFADLGVRVESAALIPIRAGDRTGILAIGSGDGARFRPDMATDVLDRLGEVVGHRLQALAHAAA